MYGHAEMITLNLVGGQRCALLQTGYVYRKATCNREAQQGSVKLNFFLQLRLLTSTPEHVHPAQLGL